MYASEASEVTVSLHPAVVGCLHALHQGIHMSSKGDMMGSDFYLALYCRVGFLRT